MFAYIAFMAAVSFVTFIAYGVDKVKAKRGSARISERRLLALALVGGAAGAMLGMLLFRHKTRHLKFILLVPLLLALQIMALISLM
jgi:uncharacterized membrane protein YsdA (DUF1294 family)